MNELVRSKPALTLAIVGAVLWALGATLAGLAYALVSGLESANTYQNLVTAGAWLRFLGVFAALGATSVVVWTLFVTRRWSAAWEAGGAAAATLVFAIGLLVSAIKAPDGSNAANIVAAVGLGGWGVLLVVSAARRALVEQESKSTEHQAGVRLGAAAAVVLLAISLGLPNPSLTDATLAITTAAIALVGFALLALVLFVAHTRSFIVTRNLSLLILSLGTLAVAELAGAISSGIVFGPSLPSMTAFRVGLSIPLFIEAVGMLLLALTAFGRIGELSVDDASRRTSTAARSPAGDGADLSPASWHADPSHRHELRWWDGLRWTEHVLDDGRQSNDTPT